MSVEGEALAGAERALPPVSGRSRRFALGTAIGAAYLTRLLFALLAGFPLVALVGASGVLDFQAGDGKLFEPGGFYLLEVLLRQRAMLLELMAPTAVLLAFGALVAVVPEWLLLRALAAPTPASPAAAAASRALPRLGALALACWCGRALLAFVTSALAMTARSYFVSARDERLVSLATAAVVLLGLLGWACLSVLHDLMAIEVAVAGAPLQAAIERGLFAARRRAAALAARYAGWTLAAFAVLAAGAAAARSFDVSAGGSLSAAGALLLHQLTSLAQTGLHAAWLSSALAVTPPRPHQGGSHPAQADAFL